MSQGRWPDRREEPRAGLVFAELADLQALSSLEQRPCAHGDSGLPSRRRRSGAALSCPLEARAGPEQCPVCVCACVCIYNS